jgi:hypothetical protein
MDRDCDLARKILLPVAKYSLCAATMPAVCSGAAIYTGSMLTSPLVVCPRAVVQSICFSKGRDFECLKNVQDNMVEAHSVNAKCARCVVTDLCCADGCIQAIFQIEIIEKCEQERAEKKRAGMEESGQMEGNEMKRD